LVVNDKRTECVITALFFQVSQCCWWEGGWTECCDTCFWWYAVVCWRIQN